MKCCLCGQEIKTDNAYSFGNNPFPICTIENARCCDKCNNAIVVPFRIITMHFKEHYDVLKRALEHL